MRVDSVVRRRGDLGWAPGSLGKRMFYCRYSYIMIITCLPKAVSTLVTKWYETLLAFISIHGKSNLKPKTAQCIS